MKRLLFITMIVFLASCIGWEEAEAEGRARRCAGASADPECAPTSNDAGTDGGSSDAGAVDAGETDAGTTDAGTTDAGMDDAGALDAGTDDGGQPDAAVRDAGALWVWNIRDEARFLVGDDSGGTFVSFDGGLVLHSVSETGAGQLSFRDPVASRPTAAFEKAGTLAVGFQSGTVNTRYRLDYVTVLASRTPPFVTTAMDLYERGTDSLGVAIYGEELGSMGTRILSVSSFLATDGGAADGDTSVTCTGSIRPMRILPSPDAGVGVVVGTSSGTCGAPFSFTSAGGFVGRFGTGGTGGFTFPASTSRPMTLGLIDDELRIAYPPVSPAGVDVAPILSDQNVLGMVTNVVTGPVHPVELVDLPGSQYLLVGWATGPISRPSGADVDLDGEDIVIVRVDAITRATLELRVLVEPGNQRVVGALRFGTTLVIAGQCTAGQLCPNGPSAFVAGLRL